MMKEDDMVQFDLLEGFGNMDIWFGWSGREERDGDV